MLRLLRSRTVAVSAAAAVEGLLLATPSPFHHEQQQQQQEEQQQEQECAPRGHSATATATPSRLSSAPSLAVCSAGTAWMWRSALCSSSGSLTTAWRGAASSHGSGSSSAADHGKSGPAGAAAAAAAAPRKKVKKKIVKKVRRKSPSSSSSGAATGGAAAGASGGAASHGASSSGGSGGGAAAASAAAAAHAKPSPKKSAPAAGKKKTRKTTTATTPAATTTAKSGKGGGVGKRAGAGLKGRGKKVKAKKSGGGSRRIRVCVLNSSYDGADSVTAAVDNFLCTPEHYAKKDKKYTFDDVAVKKIDSYRTIRELVTSGEYDVFFNLCDGGRDEKRAGVDVVQALEEMNAAFTGTDSRSFEPSKIDMKLLVGSCGVKVPNFVLLENADSLAKKCRHLRFPVIVKHLSGYASVGINQDNRCDDLEQLRRKVPAFIAEFNHALVEEFIRGREGTVLACADAGSLHGVKVFKPLMFNFLKDGDDFAFFDRKWGMTCDDKAYDFLPHNDPAHAAIIEMARHAFRFIMNGVGYGRVDFRIDDRTGEPYFLEINPNCGMWYSEKDGGDFADIMVQGDPTWSHERFLANAVLRALREQAARKPWYFISHDKSGQFSTRASRTVPAGKCLFGDAVHPIPVVTKALYKLGAAEASVGCVICRGDGVNHAVAIRHSCEPNMEFVHGRTLLFAARRPISSGEELTVDYATLRDENMPTFACGCGTRNCRSVIFAMPATTRSLEPKVARKMLREKKRAWLKEHMADREAEKLLKKRTTAAAASSAAAAAGGGGAAMAGAGGGNSTTSGGGSHAASGGSTSSGTR